MRPSTLWCAAVIINKEHILVRLWRIAALHYVLRLTRNDDAGQARPGHNRPTPNTRVKEMGMVSPYLCPPT